VHAQPLVCGTKSFVRMSNGARQTDKHCVSALVSVEELSAHLDQVDGHEVGPGEGDARLALAL
jgi:hypothetical protein